MRVRRVKNHMTNPVKRIFLHVNNEDSNLTKLTAEEEISDCFVYNSIVYLCNFFSYYCCVDVVVVFLLFWGCFLLLLFFVCRFKLYFICTLQNKYKITQ